MKEAIKPKKNKNSKVNGAEASANESISSKAELKGFLDNIRDKMTEDLAAPVYALSAMNHVLTLPLIYELLDNENKEIARDIWLRLRQSGLQLRNPPMLFGYDESENVLGK